MQARSLVLATMLSIGISAHAAPAQRGFGLVGYTAPDGFTVQDSGDHVVIMRQGSKSYCIIAIFAAQDAAGSLDDSFAASWKSIAMRAVDPVDVPATQHAQIGGRDAIVGAAMTKTQGTPVLVVLSTIDAGAKTVSVLVMTPGPDDLKVYTPSIQALLGSMTVKHVTVTTETVTVPASNDNAPVDEIPAPARPLTVADLVGEWKHGGNSIKSYVNATTGNYSGYGAVVADETWTINGKGVLLDDYNGVSSGNFGTHQVSATTTARITIKGSLLYIQPKPGEGALRIYIIRGFRVTPELTLLRIVGPWSDTQPPTDEEINDPNKAGNLQEIWVRQTKKK